MIIVLSWFELSLAANIGVRRHIEALSKRLPDKHGCKQEDGWRIHIEGAAGEMAVARALDRYYSGSVGTFSHGGDVGAIQVRTRSLDHYELIVRPGDCDEDVFVLATGQSPTYHIRGWIYGRDAKQNQWLESHGGRPVAYFVPPGALSPIELLKNTSKEQSIGFFSEVNL